MLTYSGLLDISGWHMQGTFVTLADAEKHAEEARQKEREEIAKEFEARGDYLEASRIRSRLAGPCKCYQNHTDNCMCSCHRARPSPKLEKIDREELFAPSGNELLIVDRINSMVESLRRERA